MKVLIDLQPLQTGSAIRGIGRYASSLANAMLGALEGHEIFFLFNDRVQEAQPAQLKNLLQSKIPSSHTIFFPLAEVDSPAVHLTNKEVRLSKILRERFIEALEPDIVLVTSLFEFDAVSTIPLARNRSYFCAAILYDLIPLSDPSHYLANDTLRNWYDDRLHQLKHADALLSISEYVRRDSLNRLSLPPGVIKNISAGTNLGSGSESAKRCSKEVLSWRPYVLYIGGFDQRKNVEHLITSYAELSQDLRSTYRLVLAGGITGEREQELRAYVEQLGLGEEQVRIYGYIDDQQLVDIYKNAHLFVFPSVDEGFGLPPLEAMALGIPTIASNCASLPEVVCNKDALFDPFEKGELLRKMEKGLVDEQYRSELKTKGLKQAASFSWSRSATIAAEFILSRMGQGSRGHARKYASFREFLRETFEIEGFTLGNGDDNGVNRLLARALFLGGNLNENDERVLQASELKVSEAFALSVPDYSSVSAPYVFSSMLCREGHFHLPLYTYWCKLLGEQPKFHRKQWEFVYICQVLNERGYLKSGSSAIGFGCGREPLVSVFAKFGVKVLATDLDVGKATELGWVSSNQHSDSLKALNERGLCDVEQFVRQVSFRSVDMNDIPDDLGTFDFCWSSCAFEHLGSIRKGLDFVIQSARLLKPGGIAVHTTEFNIRSNSKTLDNNLSFVIFRRRDIEMLVVELEAEGYDVEPIDYTAGDDQLERYVDVPPYIDEPHLRLELAGEYVSSSLGIIVRAPSVEER